VERVVERQNLTVCEVELLREVFPHARLGPPATEAQIVGVEAVGLALWTAYSRRGNVRNSVWFDYRNGRIVVKDPDDEICDKMKEIARVLGARVVGDEDEEY
jgi:hypothetical protein